MTHDEIRISKSVLPSLPPEYEETSMGSPRGSKKQFRNDSLVHVREYDDFFVVHMDVVDPRRDPLGHLLKDSPGTLLSVALLALGGARCLAPGRRPDVSPARGALRLRSPASTWEEIEITDRRENGEGVPTEYEKREGQEGGEQGRGAGSREAGPVGISRPSFWAGFPVSLLALLILLAPIFSLRRSLRRLFPV